MSWKYELSPVLSYYWLFRESCHTLSIRVIWNNAHFLFRNIMNPVSNTKVVDWSIRILCEPFIDWCVYVFVCRCDCICCMHVYYMYEYTCICVCIVSVRVYTCMCVCVWCVYMYVCMHMCVDNEVILECHFQKCHPPYFERQGPLISLKLTVTEAGWWVRPRVLFPPSQHWYYKCTPPTSLLPVGPGTLAQVLVFGQQALYWVIPSP